MRKVIMTSFFAFSTLFSVSALAHEASIQDTQLEYRTSCRDILRDASGLNRSLGQLERAVSQHGRHPAIERSIRETQQSVTRLENRAQITNCQNDVIQRNFGRTQAQIQDLRRTFESTPRLMNHPRISQSYQHMMRSWQELRRSINM